jgi:predicted amidophosphoribosyltransferase
MGKEKTRLEREAGTVKAMIALFCKDNHRHDSRGLCAQCKGLADYSSDRLRACRYSEKKPTCRKCTTHCYKPEYRDRVREVMRYVGPRMFSRHPVLALRHLFF